MSPPHVSQYGELRPILAAEIGPIVWGTPTNFNGFRVLRYCTALRQPNFAALNRGRHRYSAGRPSRWALAHIRVGKAINTNVVAIEAAMINRKRAVFCVDKVDAACSVNDICSFLGNVTIVTCFEVKSRQRRNDLNP